MATLSVVNSKGSKAGTVDLPEAVFGGRINTDLMHQAVVMYRASLRQGNVSTKVRKEVSGGGKKPYRQKGTGQARAGSSRSPLWHGGGVTFGPHPRDFGYSLPKKIRQAALRESIKAKCASQDIQCIEDLKENYTKTKEFQKLLDGLSLKGKILAVIDGSDQSVLKVSRNIPYFQVMRAQDVNAYDVLRHKKLLVTKTAFENLLQRISGEGQE